jgi:hypothetical protein
MAPFENGVGIDRDGSSSATYDEGVERLSAAIEVAARDKRGRGWPARVAAGLAAGLDFLAADPDFARLLAVEAPAHRRPQHERSLERLAKALRRPVTELPLGEAATEETARLLAGGLASYVAGRVLAGEAERLPESHDLLLDYILTPSRIADERRAANG